MDSQPHKSIVLLSIKPKYANAILDGTKRVEFRRTRFIQQIDYIVLYSTNPIMAVTGIIEVDDVQYDSIPSLWRRFSAVGFINKQDFDAYYYGKSTGTAIRIKRHFRFEKPVSLSCFHEITRPPQSYAYLNGSGQRILKRTGWLQ